MKTLFQDLRYMPNKVSSLLLFPPSAYIMIGVVLLIVSDHKRKHDRDPWILLEYLSYVFTFPLFLHDFLYSPRRARI